MSMILDPIRPGTSNRRPLLRRLWIYQSERFPLPAHLPLILTMAAAAQAWSAPMLGVPFLDIVRSQPWILIGSVLVLLGLFFQLRIADEVKDCAIDAWARPERPVPRGLISLGELIRIGGVLAVLQLSFALVLGPLAMGALGLIWLYGGLMTIEFGVGAWLRRRMGLYLLSHMMMMPLLLLFPMAAQWDGMGIDMPAIQHSDPEHWAGLMGTLVPLLAPACLLAYGNGLTLEIGRKIRRPELERAGVETYSAAWGLDRSLLAWWSAHALAAAALVWSLNEALAEPGLLLPLAIAVSLMVLISAALLGLGLHLGRVKAGLLQGVSGVWVLASFLFLIISQVMS